ncbi:MAG: hypothetical protein HY308_04115 [Gammaproteobacteria bacterium]|nr:hypothetical protein [Gammaproteobacteria bacterium]
MKTTDGGITWSGENSYKSNSLSSVIGIDARTAWAVGDSGAIIKITNGNSWTTQGEGISNAFLTSIAIDKAHPDTAWVAAGNVILKTTNAGNNWVIQNPNPPAIFHAIAATDANTVWVVGETGLILKTTDGGSTWVTQNSGVSSALFGVAALNTNVAWAVGEGGIVLKTTNGGATWSPQISTTSSVLFSATVVDANTVWAAGESGAIIKTVDGGATWRSQRGAASQTMRSIVAVDADTAWAVGEGGIIVKTVTGGVIRGGTDLNRVSRRCGASTGWLLSRRWRVAIPLSRRWRILHKRICYR